MELVESRKEKSGSFVGEQIDRRTQRDAMKINENPYWFDFDGTKDGVQYHAESAHHHRKRAKRNHNRKLKVASHPAHNGEIAVVIKRSVTDYQDDEVIVPDEVFSPSDVIGNIFNENDTISKRQNGQLRELLKSFHRLVLYYIETYIYLIHRRFRSL